MILLFSLIKSIFRVDNHTKYAILQYPSNERSNKDKRHQESTRRMNHSRDVVIVQKCEICGEIYPFAKEDGHLLSCLNCGSEKIEITQVEREQLEREDQKVMREDSHVREVEAAIKSNKQQDKIKVCRSKEAYDLFRDLADTAQEKLLVLHLAADDIVLCLQVAHIGPINSAFSNPADILRTTLLTGATSLIVLHNHPSGSPDPSAEDKKALQRIKEACELFQIQLRDSIIIGKDKYYSAADEGEI